MKTVRAKFECTGVTPGSSENNTPSTAYLNAVYANRDGSVNEENKSFSDATPSGHLNISISENVPASKFFEQGKDYYLDFTQVEEEG